MIQFQNADALILNLFYILQFEAEVVSLSVPQNCYNLDNRHFSIYSFNISCFQLQITFKSSKRLFYIHFLITFSFLLVSYLSLWVPIYNHTSRCALLTLPLFGIYLFDQTLFKTDELIQRESVSLHIWRLACILYIGFNCMCYVLAFYSLEMVKVLVEKYDIGYLGYLLKCAKLVDNEIAFKNGLDANDESNLILPVKKKPSLTNLNIVEPLIDLNKVGLEFNRSLERDDFKQNLIASRVRKFKINRFKTINKPLNHLKSIKHKSSSQINDVKSIKSLSIHSENEQAKQSIKYRLDKDGFQSFIPVDIRKRKTSFENLSLKDTIANNLRKDLDSLRRDLTNAKDDKQLDKQKAKTMQKLNEILSLKTPDQANLRRKKIVSRFISLSKLRTIEFISLIPSDRYARVMAPFSFFLFVYFYVFHFMM